MKIIMRITWSRWYFCCRGSCRCCFLWHFSFFSFSLLLFSPSLSHSLCFVQWISHPYFFSSTRTYTGGSVSQLLASCRCFTYPRKEWNDKLISQIICINLYFILHQNQITTPRANQCNRWKGKKIENARIQLQCS